MKVWKALGPQPLNTIRRGVDCQPLGPRKEPQQLTHEHERPARPPSPEELAASKKDDKKKKAAAADHNKTIQQTPSDEGCNSGLWLFDDRENITHFFEPNFLPPYNTPSKRMIIMDVLREEWDEKTLSWKPCGEGSMTKPKKVEPAMPTPPPAAPVEEKEETSTASPPVVEEDKEAAPVEEKDEEMPPASEPTTSETPEEDQKESDEKEEVPASTSVEEEKKEETVPEEEKESIEAEIISSTTIGSTLDNIVGDMLSNVRLCCGAPGSAAEPSKELSAAPATSTPKPEETKAEGIQNQVSI